MKTKNENQFFSEEETTVKKTTEQKTTPEDKKGGAWKSVLVGGVPGIIFGVAGTMAMEAFASTTDNGTDDGSNETLKGADSTPVYDVAHVATGVNDDMSFFDAFSAARAEVGAGGVFSWHGQVYSTYSKPEWDALGDEQRNEYAQSVADAQIHPEQYDARPEDPEIVVQDQNAEPQEQNAEPQEQNAEPQDQNAELQEQNAEPQEQNAEPQDQQSDNQDISDGELYQTLSEINNNLSQEPEVQIIGVTQMEGENGEVNDVAIGSVDGHNAAFMDIDGDGEVDAVIIDENNNGGIEEGEVNDFTDSGIPMADMAAQAEYGDAPVDDGLYDNDGMPDYTNDADISSLA